MCRDWYAGRLAECNVIGMRLAKVAETAQGLFPKYKITHTPEAWWKQLGVVRYFFASEFQRAYIANEFKVSSAASVTGLGTLRLALMTHLLRGPAISRTLMGSVASYLIYADVRNIDDASHS